MPSVKVNILGDASSLEKAYRKSEEASKTFGTATEKSASHLASFARSAVLAGGALVGVGSLYEGLKKSIDAAESFNQAQRQLDAQLRANGESLKAVQPWVDKLQKSQVQLGFTSAQTERAFTQLDRASGSAAAAYKYMGVTADLAAARHIDLSKAALLVGKVIDGNTGALNRYGIAIPKGTSAVEALRIAQQKLQGQAAASVTPFDKFHAVLNNIQVIIGNELLPVITKYLDKVTEWLSSAQNQQKITNAVKTAMHDLGVAVDIVKGIIQDLTPYVQKAWEAFKKFEDAVGGTKHAVEILGAAFVTWKLVSTFQNIGGAASGASGSVKLLATNLKLLAGLGAISIPIVLLIERKQIDAAVSGLLDKYHLPGGTHQINFGNLQQNWGKLTGANLGAKTLQDLLAILGGTIGTALTGGGTNTGVGTFGGGGGIGGGGSGSSAAVTSGKQKMLAFAKSAIGTPYLWGGAGPGGFDCSGLVQWAFANGLNINLPRTTYGQAATGRLVGSNTLKGAKAGDVIFTQYGEGNVPGPGHEGLYLGGGQVLSAPHTGARVGVTSLAGFTSGGQYTVRDLTGSGAGPPGSTALPGDVQAAQVAAGKAAAKATTAAAAAAKAAARKQAADQRAAQTAFEKEQRDAIAQAVTSQNDAEKTASAQIKVQNDLAIAHQKKLAKIQKEFDKGQTAAMDAAVTQQKQAETVASAGIDAQNRSAIAAVKQQMAAQKRLLAVHLKELQAVASGAKSEFSRAFTDLANAALNAFDRTTQQGLAGLESQRAALTPTEQLLQNMQVAHDQAAMQAQLAADQAAGDSKAVQEDQYQIQVAALQKQATAERAAQDASFTAQEQNYQDQRDAQKNAFQTQLQDLQAQLETKHTTIADANKQILALVTKFGLDPAWFTSGQNAGAALIQGLAGAFGTAGQALTAANTASAAVTKFQGGGSMVTIPTGGGSNTAGGGATFSDANTGGYPKLASGGIITASGLAYLHRGETVVPAGGRGGMISVPLILDGQVIAEALINPLRKTAQVFQRRNARTAF